MHFRKQIAYVKENNHSNAFSFSLSNNVESNPLVLHHSRSLDTSLRLRWNESVSGSQVVGEVDINEIEVEKNLRPSIPVRAFFFSTRSYHSLHFLAVGLVCPLRAAALTFFSFKKHILK
ncbi:hypothetical protein SAY86_027229 [Trapa natans]|uniref:Uncharacterized protein n=1 Tax=Trapa natans TaxID=22666 RepID=A0AAN7KQB1_TRANT|nr:hypothetical protein SAY86_027229 [Trapa natans]